MILGYEQPVDIPVMSIYDKQAIRDYVGAVLKDYLDARAAEDAFYEKYGKFYSPVIGANDAYYDATIGKVQKVYDDMVKRGIDPIRTPEGRAMIRLAIRSVDVPYSNSIKANSEGIETYLKNQAQLIANGQYDDNLNKWFLNKRGLDPYNFDFRHQTWDVMSPLKKTTINEQLAPTIQDLAKNGYDLDKELTRKNPGYRVSTVTPQRMLDALNTNVDDLMKDPRMQYFKETSGLNDEQFKLVLLKHMAAELQPRYETDQVYLEMLKLNEQRRQHNDKMALERLKLSKGDEEPILTSPLTTRVSLSSEEKHFKNIVDPQMLASYYDNKAKHEKGPRMKKGYQNTADMWRKFSSLSTHEQLDLLIRNGYIDKAGRPTKTFLDIRERAMNGFRGNKYQSREKSIQNANYLYNSYMTLQTGAAKQTFVENLSDRKSPGGYRVMTFGNGTNYSVARLLQFAGIKSKGAIDGEYKFDEYLRKQRIQGNAYDTSGLTAGRLPNGQLETSGIGISVKLEHLNDFISAAKKNGYKIKGKSCKGKSDSWILSNLGVSVVDVNGKIVSSEEYDAENTKYRPKKRTVTKGQIYAIIPSSTTVDANGVNLSGINDTYNKNVYGASKAYDEANNVLDQSQYFN